MGRYDDIINLSRPKSGRPSMPIGDRAKIFMPFAALKGHEEAIDEKKKVFDERIEITDEKKEELNKKLEELSKCSVQGKNEEITVTYFHVDETASAENESDFGNYVEITGTVTKVDNHYKYIKVNDTNILFKDIVRIR